MSIHLNGLTRARGVVINARKRWRGLGARKIVGLGAIGIIVSTWGSTHLVSIAGGGWRAGGLLSRAIGAGSVGG